MYRHTHIHVYIFSYLSIKDTLAVSIIKGRFRIQRANERTRRGNWSMGEIVERVRIRRHVAPN